MSNSPEEHDPEAESLPPEPAPGSTPGAPMGTRRRRPIDEPADDYQRPHTPGGRGYGCADVITAIFLLLSVASVSLTILLIANPQSPLNPFPPPTLPRLVLLATPQPTFTPSITPTPLPATPTLPTPTRTPLPSATITNTPTASYTPVVGGAAFPTLTAPPQTATPKFTLSPFPFTAEPVKYVGNAGKEGCQWQSIAGSVVDMNGKPIKGLALRVTGSNGNIDEFAYTGTQPRYGDSGFEVFLGTTPHEDNYTIQLLGRTSNPISDIITITTKADCNSNVAVIAFSQNHPY